MMSNSVTFACPSCFGAAQGPMIDGMNTAILTLLGITGFMLITISSFFIYMWRRTSRLREQITRDSFIDEQGIIHLNQKKGLMEWNNS
jgi:hypothetical protein